MSIRTLRLLFLVSVSLLSGCIHSHGTHDQDTRALLHTIRSQLPPGWSANHDPRHQWLEIVCDTAIPASATTPNAPLFATPEPQFYGFAFRIRPAVSASEFRRLRDENTATDQALAALYDELSRSGMGRKFDRFLPRTEVEAALVSRYEALKASRHALPDFRFRRLSLHYHPASTRPADATIASDCEAVRHAVLALFSSYRN